MTLFSMRFLRWSGTSYIDRECWVPEGGPLQNEQIRCFVCRVYSGDYRLPVSILFVPHKYLSTRLYIGINSGGTDHHKFNFYDPEKPSTPFRGRGFIVKSSILAHSYLKHYWSLGIALIPTLSV